MALASRPRLDSDPGAGPIGCEMVERALERDGVRLHLGAEITDLLERQGVSASRLHRAKYRDDQAAEGRGRMKRTFSD